MRSTTMLVLAAHILLYISVFLDAPVLRPIIGFVYLTFLPGFVILHALRVKTDGVAVELSLSVALSIAFVMFVGLLLNALHPLLAAPLSILPLTITISALTLTIFVVSHTKKICIFSNKHPHISRAEMSTEGVVLCVVSILLLILSIVGALYHSVFLLLSAIAGTAAIFITSVFIYKRISSSCYLFALFVVSFSLLVQTSLISRHIMGWDIFREYFVYKSVFAAGYWASPGVVQAITYDPISNLNSVLSVTILPATYSTILNLNGELIFKIIYPFIFCFVPIFLFKIYETQAGKIVALLSVFFFIADPMNLYGLAPLSLMREMITYLFISATVFCFVRQDMDLTTRRALVIAFSAALAVSHYSLAFLFAFFVVFVFVAMRVAGRKDPMMNLTLVLSIVGITFAWYMYVATPPLNNLTDALTNIASRLTTDLFNTENRLDPGMTVLSPTSQAMNINGLIHKIVIYISEFFVVVGTIVLVIKPKEFEFHTAYRWMAIFSAFLLSMCIAVPNVAPTLNFMRFYRYVMMFLAPLFTLGGVYFLGLFRKIPNRARARVLDLPRFVYGDFRLLILTIVLVIFFLFRSGFVNTATGDSPYSHSLDFDRMRTSAFYKTGPSLYGVYVPEQDFLAARWLDPRIRNDSRIYADYEMGIITLIDYTTLNRNNMDYIANGTQKPGSYMYLRSFNVLEGLVTDSSASARYLNLSDLSPSISQNDLVYSNGASDIYFAP